MYATVCSIHLNFFINIKDQQKNCIIVFFWIVLKLKNSMKFLLLVVNWIEYTENSNKERNTFDNFRWYLFAVFQLLFQNLPILDVSVAFFFAVKNLHISIYDAFSEVFILFHFWNNLARLSITLSPFVPTLISFRWYVFFVTFVECLYLNVSNKLIYYCWRKACENSK
jgi:hypothetical protein